MVARQSTSGLRPTICRGRQSLAVVSHAFGVALLGHLRDGELRLDEAQVAEEFGWPAKLVLTGLGENRSLILAQPRENAKRAENPSGKGNSFFLLPFVFFAFFSG